MLKDKVVIVVLRQPTNKPSETRADPYWEFGSFGITTCHSRNILNHKKITERKGIRLAFSQGGKDGFKLVHLTPPIIIKMHNKSCEAKWEPIEMPFHYQDAPLLINNNGKSSLPLLKQAIAGARCKSWMQKFSSCFRSRCEPLDNGIASEILSVYEKGASEINMRASSYIDALPYPPPKIETDRKKAYDEKVKKVGGVSIKFIAWDYGEKYSGGENENKS